MPAWFSSGRIPGDLSLFMTNSLFLEIQPSYTEGLVLSVTIITTTTTIIN